MATHTGASPWIREERRGPGDTTAAAAQLWVGGKG